MVHVGVDMDTSEMERQIYASVDDLYFPVSSYNELEHVQMNVAEILCSQTFNYYETGHYITLKLVWFTLCFLPNGRYNNNLINFENTLL